MSVLPLKLVKPPCSEKRPADTKTVPELLNSTSMLVAPLPALLVKVPALLTSAPVPA